MSQESHGCPHTPGARSSLKIRSPSIIASPDASGGPSSVASIRTPGGTIVTAKSGLSIGCGISDTHDPPTDFRHPRGFQTPTIPPRISDTRDPPRISDTHDPPRISDTHDPPMIRGDFRHPRSPHGFQTPEVSDTHDLTQEVSDTHDLTQGFIHPRSHPRSPP
jgi:hypothetical protein